MNIKNLQSTLLKYSTMLEKAAFLSEEPMTTDLYDLSYYAECLAGRIEKFVAKYPDSYKNLPIEK